MESRQLLGSCRLARIGRFTSLRRLSAALACCGFLMAPAAFAGDISRILDNDPDVPSLSNYGGAGLLDTRTARFMPDGYLASTVSLTQPDFRFALTFEALPWAEFTFRYSINHALKNGDTSLYDRSFDIKTRLFQETPWTPQIALGLQDFLGTGVYSGEYLVASKRLGDFDLSTGLGWGRLGSRGLFPNPFGLLSAGFKTRNIDSGQGGVPLFSSYFHGPQVGLFGGISYRTPVRDLAFKIEYSSDRYAAESKQSGKDYGFPVNAGFSYRAWPGVDLGLSFMHGNSIGFNLNTFFDPAEDISTQRIDPPPRFVARDQDSVDELKRQHPPQPATGESQIHFIDLTKQDSEIQPAKAANLAWKRTPDGEQLVAETPQQQLADATQFASPAPKPIPGFKFIDLSAPEKKPELVWKPTQNGVLLVSDTGPVKLPLYGGMEEPVSYTNLSGSTELGAVTSDGAPIAEPADGTAQSGAADDDASSLAGIKAALEAQSLEVDAIHIFGDRLSVIIANYHYRRDTEAVARAARVLSATVPLHIETFSITTYRLGLLLTTTTLTRQSLDGLARNQSSPGNLWLSTDLEPASSEKLDELEVDYPHLTIHYLYPTFQQGLFDPDNPFYFRIAAGSDATVMFLQGLSIEAAADGSIIDTFNEIRRQSNSLLPHVRTDIAEYLKKGKYGFSDLQGSYTARAAPELFARVAVGYFENMFAGVGGEVLYRPFGQRWAIGADLWDVKQRTFDRLFAFRDYQVITGHVTFYYDLPWHDLSIRLHVGRYLAGDYGATLEAVRRFDTGIEIGAWATFTNVSAQQFGEGSFDKGLIIRVPLEWVTHFATQGLYDLELRSVQRDGGQRLDNVERLYDATESSSYGQMMDQWSSAFR
jgi:hypothetical protein